MTALMPLFWVVVIDLLLLWFFFGSWILDKALPASLRRRRALRCAQKQLSGRLARNRDLLSEGERRRLEELIGKLGVLRKAGGALDEKACEALLDEAQGEFAREQKAFSHHGVLGTYFETLLVSVAVAFAIRSLFLQPFKIPTGSMQPTLYGIHAVALEEEQIPQSKWAAAFDYLNYSRRYFRLEPPADGVLDYNGIRALPSKPLFPYSQIPLRTDDGRTCELDVPASVTDTQRLFLQLEFPPRAPWQNPFRCTKGQTLFRGAMESGDHLFVNRLSLCFRQPKRGDIMVFSTEGLSYKGQSLAGAHYVKRLVGLPGDTLKIRDRVLYVRPRGESEFRPLDGTYSDAFGRIQSRKNGYAGHAANAMGSHLVHEGDEYTVPEEHYFLMGDNTDNSLDCRFFGAVPRKNLMGGPCLIWWPFTQRFGWGFDKG